MIWCINKKIQVTICSVIRVNTINQFFHCYGIGRPQAATNSSFGRIKNWRRIAMRDDRCPTIFFGAVTLAVIVIFWLEA